MELIVDKEEDCKAEEFNSKDMRNDETSGCCTGE
jgi:hypothetical protein